MTSEIGRMFKCLKNKSSYHSLEDDAYTHITLLQTEDINSSSQPNQEINSSPTDTKHSNEIIPLSLPHHKSLDHSTSCLKTRSLDSLSQDEALQRESNVECHLNENISSPRSISPSDQRSSSNCSSPAIGDNTSNVIGKVINNNPNNNSSSSGSSSGGGLFSFLGLKFNKSSTRHLDRTGDSADKSEPCNPNRYTKFPLRGSSSSSIGSGGHVLEVSSESSAVVTPDPSSSSSRSSVESHSQSSSETSSAPQSNSKFDISQIQLTPQTKFYSNPHRSSPSACQSFSRKGTFSPSNFITKSICSFSKKSGSSGNHKLKSSGPFYKRKSKSDNNLHRIDPSFVGGHSTALFSNILGAAGSSGSGASRGVTSSSSQNIYNSEPGAELRLNSVQIGDHATIILPWTGLEDQRNNLSNTTSSRTHQNTHNNNFDSSGGSGVRYVECGFKWSRQEPSNHFVRPEITHSHLRHIHHRHHHTNITPTNSSIEYTSCTVRRSKSLERDAGFRINPRNSIACCSAGTLNSSHSSACSTASSFSSRGDFPSRRGGSKGKKLVQSRDTSPNPNFGLHQVHRCLTPEEQEALLRNITWDSFPLELRSETPPPRPEKPASLRNKFPSSSCKTTKPFGSNSASSFRPKKPPHIGSIHRSAPNSFSVSSDSNDSLYNCSAPPSPPPRPPSSLKPTESRLISSPTIGSQVQKNQRILTEKTCQSGGVLKSNSLKSSSPSSGHCFNVASPKTEPIKNFDTETSSQPSTAIVPSQSQQSSSSGSGHIPTHLPSKMSIVEEEQNSRFVHKPMKGWLHADQSILSKEGVTYKVRYIGCLDVNKSMKSLDFETRSTIAKECINQVCEAAGMKTIDRKGKFDHNVTRILGTRPRLENSGLNVQLTITSTCLKLSNLDTGHVISSHDMPNISFASGGDSTMLDFIAFVAKDPVVGRACFILECASGLAQDVIITIGQAFELRFKEYIQKRPPPPRLPAPDDREYYNDLPGKLPPTDDRTKANGNHEVKTALGGKLKEIPTLTLPVSSETSVNLIDFEAPTPKWEGSGQTFCIFPTTQERHLESILLGSDSSTFPTPSSLAAGASSGGTGLGLPNSPSQPNKSGGNKDPFDMQPFESDLPKPLSGPEQRKQLETQNWFHGCISRNKAEKIVKNDGDFLVRESQTTSGQYVLTGIQNGSPKHLLLVDPAGVVRTKDQTFENVTHLVRHHSDNCLPIISGDNESMVILRNPVIRESVPLP